MPLIRMLIATYRTGDLPVDYITNTIYLNKIVPEPILDTEYQGLADDTAELFGTYRPLPETYDHIEVRAYNMSDAEPRPVRATAHYDSSNNTAGASTAREVALCLSFYGERNLPRTRGRIYIGPWQKTQVDERPAATYINQLQDLANGISGLGGVDIQWDVVSTVGAGANEKVQNYWIDNEWDTQRRRGLEATSRLRGTVNG